jgi:hypothetical protein
VDVAIDDIMTGVEPLEVRRKAAERAEDFARGGVGKAAGRTIICETYTEGDTNMGDINMRDNYGQVAGIMTNCTNMVNQQAPGPKKDAMAALRRDVEELIKRLPDEKKGEAEKVAEDLELAIKQAAKEKPDRPYFSLSAQGLLEAATWVKDCTVNVASTILILGTLIWPDFTLPQLPK